MRNARLFHKRVLAVLVALVSGCHDMEPTAPQPEGVSAIVIKGRSFVLVDLKSTQVSLPPQPRDYDIDDGALDRALERNDHVATIAFKAPGSLRIGQAEGIRAALSAEDARNALDMLQRTGVEVLDIYGHLGMARVRIPRGAASTLRQSPMVDFIEPTPVRQRAAEANVINRLQPGIQVSHFGTRMSSNLLTMVQTTPWNVSLVRAPQAWSYGTGASAKIMVLSNGVSSHEDLPGIPSGNCYGLSNSCAPYYGDGTLLAGIAAARDNSIGIVGIAPGLTGSNIVSWRVVADDSYIDLDQVMSAYNNAAYLGVDVILHDVSYFEYWLSGATAVSALWAEGIIVVAGVGTGGFDVDNAVYPATLSQPVAVSGVKPDSSFASSVSGCNTPSSNYGQLVDVSAPYWAYSTAYGTYYDTKGTWGWCSTRIAVAHVAGVVALLRDRHPTWNANQIHDALIMSASGNGTRIGDQLGYGIVNAGAAMTWAEPPQPDIDGPTVVPADNQVCYYHGRVLTGGTEPFYFEWYVNGSFVTSGENLDYGGPYSFTLKLRVTDSTVPTAYVREFQWNVSASGSMQYCENPDPYP